MAVWASGLSVPEGPVWLADGSLLVVEMGAERGCITRIDSQGENREEIRKTGRPNGLAIDKANGIWVAESLVPSLLRITLEGEITASYYGAGDDAFLFPNDLCFGPNDKLYFTDSGIRFEDFAPGGKVRPDYMDAPINGRVYEFDLRNETFAVIDTGLRFPNGLAFGPDGHLYVNETLSGMVYRYVLKDGRMSNQREIFGNVLKTERAGSMQGPDGMKFDSVGNLYVTVFGQGDITVLNKDGAVAMRIPTEGKLPTNLAFSLHEKRIYVTEDELGTIEVFEVDAEGLPLFYGA